MYTLVNLKQIIDTLPLYAKKEFEDFGADKINVTLDDIFGILSEYDKQMFIKNNSKELIRYLDNQDMLDMISSDEIVDYLESLGYSVQNYE